MFVCKQLIVDRATQHTHIAHFVNAIICTVYNCLIRCLIFLLDLLLYFRFCGIVCIVFL